MTATDFVSRILVVDDIDDNRELLVRRLARQGYVVEEARGGTEALRRIQAGGIDLVLLDIMMPDVDGLTVLRTIRREHPADQLPVIMVTARDQNSAIVEALDAGASDYVTKPIDTAIVLARVRTQLSLLSSRRAVSFERRRLHEIVIQLQTVTEALGLFVETGDWRQASDWLLGSALSQTDSPGGLFAVLLPGYVLRVLAQQGLSWPPCDPAPPTAADDPRSEPGCPEGVPQAGLLREACERGTTIACGPGERLDDRKAPPFDVLGTGSLMIVPVRAETGVAGLIVVTGRATPYLAEERAKLELLAQPAAVFCRHYGQQKQQAFLEAQLHRSRRMESIGKLAGGVAHDFNNNLTVIRGYSDLILEQVADDPELGPMMEEVVRAAERAAQVTSQLLAFGRRQVLRPLPVDVGELVGRLLVILRPMLTEKIQLKIEPPPEPVIALADHARVEQVVMNLVENAREAMPEGGVVRIRTRQARLDEETLRENPELTAGPYALLEVEDTGRGMAPDVARRCFEPFFTTKDVGQGPGLGLSMVEGFVTQSGGFVRVHSVPGQGTRFEVFLPLAEATQPAPSPAPPTEAAHPGTILVADDDPSVRRLIVSTLKSRGFQVLSAGEPAEALQVAALHDGPIDLLLTDVLMPGASGFELFQKLSATRPVRVLYISGYAERSMIETGDLPPTAPFLSKPFTPDALIRRVRQILE